MSFLTVMDDLIESSVRRSSSQRLGRQLPSMDALSRITAEDTECGVETVEADKLEPDLNVGDCPFGRGLRQQSH